MLARTRPLSWLPPSAVAEVWIRRAEVAAGMSVTALLVLVHVTHMRHAGALWRDEANTLNVATMPTVSEFWAALHFDSFPALWPLLVRAWAAVGLGPTDAGYRLLGLLVGVSVLAALWWHSRVAGLAAPSFSLLLLAGSPAMIRWGDSLRAYGLGILLLLAAAALIWRLVERPSTGRTAAAAAATVLSVHALYHNAIIVLALVVSAVAVGMRRADWRLVPRSLAVGLAGALSLGIYAAQIRGAYEWNALVKLRFGSEWLLERFGQTVGLGGVLVVGLWPALMAAALVSCALCVLRARGLAPHDEADRALFTLVAVVVGVVAYGVFLRAVSYEPQPWYYLSLMALLAVSIDAGIHLAVRMRTWLRVVRLVAFAVVAIAIAGPGWRAAHVRQTNVDVVAGRLAAMASREDLIVVNPWWVGVSFARYAKGGTPWVTLPDIDDHRVHRYDLVKRKLSESDPMGPLLGRIGETLRSGGRVWFLGRLGAKLDFHPPGTAPITPAPAPNAQWGWNELPYLEIWSSQAGYFVETHARTVTELEVAAAESVSRYERLRLIMADGWRD